MSAPATPADPAFVLPGVTRDHAARMARLSEPALEAYLRLFQCPTAEDPHFPTLPGLVPLPPEDVLPIGYLNEMAAHELCVVDRQAGIAWMPEVFNGMISCLAQEGPRGPLLRTTSGILVAWATTTDLLPACEPRRLALEALTRVIGEMEMKERIEQRETALRN